MGSGGSFPTPATDTNTALLWLGAAVAVIIAIGLIVLLALGKVSWAEAGPVVTILAGVHTGASLTAYNAK